MNHFENRRILEAGFQLTLGRATTPPEALLVHAWAQVESGCGLRWGDSNNWGSIQKGMTWDGPTFEATDTHPNPDGTSTPYSGTFRAYESPTAGAAALVALLFKTRHMACAEPAAQGDLKGFCASLYASNYFEGHGKTEADRILHRQHAVLAAAISIARELGERLPDGNTAPDTVRPGDEGHCADLALALVRSRGYDSIRAFQNSAIDRTPVKLVADGICGPSTWALLLLLCDARRIGEIASKQFAIENVRFAQRTLAEVEAALVRGLS